MHFTSFPFPLEYRNETPISRKNSRESKMIEKAFAFVEGKEDRRAKVNRYWRRIEITVIKKNNKKKRLDGGEEGVVKGSSGLPA